MRLSVVQQAERISLLVSTMTQSFIEALIDLFISETNSTLWSIAIFNQLGGRISYLGLMQEESTVRVRIIISHYITSAPTRALYITMHHNRPTGHFSLSTHINSNSNTIHITNKCIKVVMTKFIYKKLTSDPFNSLINPLGNEYRVYIFFHILWVFLSLLMPKLRVVIIFLRFINF